MERDFLGVGGKGPAAKDEAAIIGNSGVHCPFSNKIPSIQQFMNFKASQDDRQKRIMFNHRSSSAFQPMPNAGVFYPVHRSSSLSMPQKFLCIDRHGIHRFQQDGYPALVVDPSSSMTADHSNETKMFAAVSNHSTPPMSSRPSFPLDGLANGSGPGTPLKQQPAFISGFSAVVGDGSMKMAFASRNQIEPSATAAQLTIFYAGTVNVYDDIPLEKAQAIMFSAANCSSMNLYMSGVGTHIPMAAPNIAAEDVAISAKQTKNMNEIQQNAAQPCSMVCSPKSKISDMVTQFRTSIPAAQPDPSKTVIAAVGSTAGSNLSPRAIPQARKASLARFLEKRKERMMTAAPYPPPLKSPECSAGFDGNSMKAESANSSNKEQSWRLGAHKNNSSSSSSPSDIRLEI